MTDATGWQPPDRVERAPVAAPSPAPAPRPDVGAPADRLLPLRPLAVGELLDGAIAVLRGHARTVFAISGVVVVAEALLSLLLRVAIGGRDGLFGARTGSGLAVTGTADALLTGAGVVVLLFQAAVTALLAGVLAPLVAEVLQGASLDRAGLLRRIRPLLPRLSLAAVLAGALPWLALPLLGFGVFLWGALALVTPALVLERCGVGTALRRSWQLGVGGWLRVWGVRALGYLVATVVGLVLVLPLSVAGVFAFFTDTAGQTLPTSLLVLSLILGFVVRLLTAPFEAVLLTLLYLDRRMRAEALDLVLTEPALRAA